MKTRIRDAHRRCRARPGFVAQRPRPQPPTFSKRMTVPKHDEPIDGMRFHWRSVRKKEVIVDGT